MTLITDNTRSVFSIILFAVCIFLSSKTYSTTLLFTSNIPNLFETDGSYSIGKLSAFISEYRSQSDRDVIFVHGGDSLFPNALSFYDSGAHMIDLLNVIGTDVFAVNQREFREGVDPVTLRSLEAGFPMVQSNLIDDRTGASIEGVIDKYIRQSGNETIGFISVLDESIKEVYLTRDVSVEPPVEKAERLAQELKAQGVGLVVLITEPEVAKHNLDLLTGLVDIILVTEETEDYVVNDNILTVYSGGTDGEIAIVNWVPGQKPSAKIESFSNYKEDPKLQSSLEKYLGRLELVIERELVTLLVDADTIKSNIRSSESALGNLFVDAIREEVGTDFAALNSGAIRGNRKYHKGDVLRYKDIQTELPFGGSLYIIKVTKSELIALMEHSVSRVDTLHGAYFQVSGFEVAYDSSRPVGKRLISLTQNGQELDSDKIYTLAVPDYIRYGGDSYDIREDQVVNKASMRERVIWNVVAENLSRKGNVSPRVEGRLLDLVNDPSN